MIINSNNNASPTSSASIIAAASLPSCSHRDRNCCNSRRRQRRPPPLASESCNKSEQKNNSNSNSNNPVVINKTAIIANTCSATNSSSSSSKLSSSSSSSSHYYYQHRLGLVTLLSAALCCCMVVDVSSHPDRTFITKTGNITIGFILPIHSWASNQKNEYDYQTTCGKFEASRALLVALFRRAIEEINNSTSPILPGGIKLGYWILDSCSTSAVGLLQFVNKWANNKANVAGAIDAATHERLPALVIGAYKSSTSALLAPVLQQFDIPLLDFAATSPDLSDRRRYRLYARTTPSDVYQATAMAEFVSIHGWSCVHLVYSHGTYGDHGSDELKAALRRHHVCIGTEAGVTVGSINSERAELNSVVEKFQEWPEVHIVLCFCEESTIRSLLTALWNFNQNAGDENDGPNSNFIVIASDFWGTKLDLNGLESVADGAITFTLTNSANMTRFGEWFVNDTTTAWMQADMDPWYKEYAESVLKCTSFPCPMTDSRRQRMNASLLMAEDVTGLLNTSIYAAVYGLKSFLQQAPPACTKGLQVGSISGCGLANRDGAKLLYDAIRQVTFRTENAQTFRFDENGDGFEPSYDITRYSRYTGYSKIGEWSLDHGLVLNSNAETSETGEPIMYWPGDGQVLVTSNCSCSLNDTSGLLPSRIRPPFAPPRSVPCNNETVFWSMYGLMAQQLKNCQCNASTSSAGAQIATSSAGDASSSSLLPIIIGLSAALGIVIVFLAILAAIRLFAWCRKKQKMRSLNNNKTVANNNKMSGGYNSMANNSQQQPYRLQQQQDDSKTRRRRAKDAAALQQQQQQIGELAPSVRVLPPSFISMNGGIGGTQGMVVTTRKISGQSTASDQFRMANLSTSGYIDALSPMATTTLISPLSPADHRSFINSNANGGSSSFSNFNNSNLNNNVFHNNNSNNNNNHSNSNNSNSQMSNFGANSGLAIGRSISNIRPMPPGTMPMISRFSTASSASSTSAILQMQASPRSPMIHSSVSSSMVAATVEPTSDGAFRYHNQHQRSPTKVNSPGSASNSNSAFFSTLAGVRDSQELSQMVERWNIAPSRLSFGEQLGQGRFGIVYKGLLKASPPQRQDSGGSASSGLGMNQDVAIKVLKSQSPDAVVQFLQEGFIMQGFDHPNILKLIGISIITDEPHIVVPFMRNGNLRDFLSNPENNLIDHSSADAEFVREHMMDFCIQICSGMEYLARNKCVHRDLACRNILVGDTNLLKIADFGLARDLFETDYYSPSTLHRPLPVRWHPPESLRLHRFEERSDVWSFGVVCWEIFSFGAQPYPALTNAQVFDFVLSGNRLPKPQFCTDDMYAAVMLRCWDEYRSLRPSFSELLVVLHTLMQQQQQQQQQMGAHQPYLQHPQHQQHHNNIVKSNSTGHSNYNSESYMEGNDVMSINNNNINSFSNNNLDARSSTGGGGGGGSMVLSPPGVAVTAAATGAASVATAVLPSVNHAIIGTNNNNNNNSNSNNSVLVTAMAAVDEEHFIISDEDDGNEMAVVVYDDDDGATALSSTSSSNYAPLGPSGFPANHEEEMIVSTSSNNKNNNNNNSNNSNNTNHHQF